MGLVNYKDIDFNKSINKENKTINFNGSEIQIVNYLSSNDKNDLISITLQKSFDGITFNNYKLNMYFDLHLVYLFTNIVFSKDDMKDEEELFDTLYRSGLINLIKDAIPKKEIETLWQNVLLNKSALENYYNSFAYFISNTIEDLEEKVNHAIEIIKTLNIEELLKRIQSIQKNPEQIVAE